MKDAEKKAKALAYMSGVIKGMDKYNDEVSTEDLITAWNNALDEYDVESEVLHLEA